MAPSIQNFHLIRQIGEGGFGEVWLAETVTGKRRAVKWVRRERFHRPGLSPAGVEALFLLEFKGVQHFEDLAARTPELISILHVGKTDDDNAYYYIMPLADNALPVAEGKDIAENYQPLTLQRWLELNGPMDWQDAISLLATIARGAAALHRAGLQHGDISSSNVLWVDRSPVLGDPGLTSLDGHKTGGASPGFSDPAGQSGKTSDVFSLGRLFYHALSGKHPAESFPILPADRMAGIPAAQLADLLDRCCDPDPAARFQDADELLAFLEPITGQGPSHGRRGRSLLISGLAIGLISLIGVLLWSIIHSSHDKHSVIFDGKRVSLLSKTGDKVFWELELGHPVEHAELTDLDGDGKPEVVCSMRDTGNGRPGRLTAIDLAGSIRWQFDLLGELQDFGGLGQKPMRMAAFKPAELDGSPGNELIVLARNQDNLYSTSVQIVGCDGELRSCYWHPGRIEQDQLVVIRRSPKEPPFLAFYGQNHLIEPLYTSDRLPKEGSELVIGLLDPRARGQVHPPGIGTSGFVQPGPLLWYRRIVPPGSRARSLHSSDENGDGIQDLVLWIEPFTGYPADWQQSVVSFDLEGKLLTQDPAANRVLQIDEPASGPSALQPVDFDRLTRDRLLTLSERDFSSTHNGANGWEYGSVSNGNFYQPEAFRKFQYHDDQNLSTHVYWNHHENAYTTIGNTAMGPGAERVVRRWTSPYSGRIAMVVNARRGHGIEWGTSALEIHHQNTRLHRVTLGKARFQAVIKVKQGDHLDFVVDSDGKDWADRTDIFVGIWKYD